jgi:hypothetical protein
MHHIVNFDGPVKTRKMPFPVIPANAGIQSFRALPDSRLSTLRSRATAEDGGEGQGEGDCHALRARNDILLMPAFERPSVGICASIRFHPVRQLFETAVIQTLDQEDFFLSLP